MDVTIPDAEMRLRETRQLFQRVLAQWASDLLAMQQRGERHPCWKALRTVGHHAETGKHGSIRRAA